VEIKCQLDATEVFFIADLIACSTCFGHHYAHHQELKIIIPWLLSVVFGAVKMYKVICKLGRICILSIKCRVLSRFVVKCVECRGGRVWVSLVGFLQDRARWFLSVGQLSAFVGYDCMTAVVLDRCI